MRDHMRLMRAAPLAQGPSASRALCPLLRLSLHRFPWLSITWFGASSQSRIPDAVSSYVLTHPSSDLPLTLGSYTSYARVLCEGLVRGGALALCSHQTSAQAVLRRIVLCGSCASSCARLVRTRNVLCVLCASCAVLLALFFSVKHRTLNYLKCTLHVL